MKSIEQMLRLLGEHGPENLPNLAPPRPDEYACRQPFNRVLARRGCNALTEIVPREIQDCNTKWKLAQVYAGLEKLNSTRKDVARKEGLVRVIATPDGGAQSVRLHLPADWESASSDEDVLVAIVAAR